MYSRSVSFHAKLFCVALAYALIITTFAPFMVRPVEAAPANQTASASLSPKKGRKRSGELLVRFRANVSNEDRATLAEAKGGRREKILRGESSAEKLVFPEGQDTDALAAELRLNPAVELVEPNYLVEKDEAIPDDPSFSEQWALKNTVGQVGADLNAAVAWETTTGAPSTVIAVIDSGIDFSHPDLKNNRWVNGAERANNRDDDRDGLTDDLYGWDWVTDSGTIRDEQGHGTTVAGIIAAQGNNQMGTAGVMWRASLMSLRVLDNTGTGDVASAVEAIDYAVAHGAHVINCSWGMYDESALLKDAIERAGKKGVVVVTSAGNDATDIETAPYYPASFALPNLISVASTDQFDQLASFSNYGAQHVTIAAPGTNILTTQMGGGYRSVTGTSASAPLVAGVAGLVKTLRPWLTAAGTRSAIVDGARRVDALMGRVATGAVVNAAGAIGVLRGPDNLPSGNGNGGNSGGNGQGQPPQLPPSGKGTGGSGKDGGFAVDPPEQTTGAPGANLPNLDQLRKEKNTVTQPTGKIRANLPCTDCDPYGGGGGGTSGYYPTNDPVYGTARTLPRNETGQPGEDLGSQNFNWSLPLLRLPGRAGLDLSLALYYNSLVWTKDGNYIKYNADHGSPGPGFHLGMPFIQQRYLNSEVGVYSYMMVTPSGGGVEMRQVGSTNVYESADNSNTQMIDNDTTALVRDKEGMQYSFSLVNAEFRCTQIKDRNGNYITIEYDANGHITRITDALGRQVNFNYGADQNLSSITQDWGGVTHTWAQFYYGQVYMQPSFSVPYLNGPLNSYQTVLTSVVVDDGSSYTFDYTPFGQVWKFTKYSPNSQALNVVAYNVSGSTYAGVTTQSECPRFTERHDWALNWNNNNEVVTTYSVAADGSYAQETSPDGTTYKEYFATSGWQKGLTTKAEMYAAGSATPKKTTETLWTQDNTGVSYKLNPRPYDIKIYDEANNLRRTTVDYTTYGLPSNVREYAADGQTVLRRTETQYRFDTEFINHHILGVVWMKLVYEVTGGQEHLVSKVNFHHDWDYWNPTEYSNGQAPSVGHDTTNYGAPFFGRANVTGVYNYNINAPDDPNQAVLIQRIGYNLAGEPIYVKDAQGHAVQISYADSYSDNNNTRGTLAYPTTLTDADGYAATAQYHYQTGLVTRSVDPKSATFNMQYDAAGRLEQVTNQFNNSYTRYVYSTDGLTVQQFATLKTGTTTEAYNFTIHDGAGRVRAVGGDMPGSAGGYRAQFFAHDTMGRVWEQTNPEEVNGAFTPTGDDSAWIWTTQTYDWKGRPLVTTNPDGTTTENSYAGCGCAGGEQVTTRDERGRRKRMTMDVLGRLKQVEELNWDQSVYSTTTYAYNGRDQITEINQEGRTRSFVYDGFGRLYQRTTPEQGTTTYAYNADDTINYVDDARGARATYGYNNRHLVTSINYNQPSGVALTNNVVLTYDAAGNRTSMIDGLGSMSYEYNTLSQMTAETRYFTGLGSYRIAYSYELGGQLASVAHYNNASQLNSQVGYQYDTAGRLTGVTGAGYAGVSSYAGNLQYRATGGLKAMTYGNNRQLSIQYDSRQRMSRWDVANVLGYNYAYNNFSENTGRVTYAQNIYDSTLDRSYDYDHVGRLTSAHTGLEARWHIGAQAYSGIDGPYSQDRGYDVFGNVTHRVGWGGWQGSGVDETLSYNSKNQITTNPANNATMTYDATGNLTNDGEQVYGYDVLGQQTYASGTGLSQGYDGDGRRGVKGENSAYTYYLRSSVLGGQVIAEIDGGGAWQRGYVYLGSQLLAVQRAGVYWVHQDPVAKSQRLTDASGTVTTAIELDPWGGETSRITNSAFQPHKFTTYERDANNGDDAMFRRYQGKWNRFAQPDPADVSYSQTNPQSLNRYAYVQNDPVNLVDPTGLYQVCTTQADGNVTCTEVGGAPGVQLDGGPIYYATERETVHMGLFDAIGALMDLSRGPGDGFPRATPTASPRGTSSGPRLDVPRPQPTSNPPKQQQAAQPNPQQQGFDDCARAAVSRLRKAEYRAIAKIGVGTVGATVGMYYGGVGLNRLLFYGGLRGARVISWTLSGQALQLGTGVSTAVSLFSGGMAYDGFLDSGRNHAQLNAALEDCKAKFPQADHSTWGIFFTTYR